MIRSQPPKFALSQSRLAQVAALFRLQKNHARELERRGNQLNHDTREERPEYTQENSVVQLKEVCCYPERSDEIDNESRDTLTMNLPQV